MLLLMILLTAIFLAGVWVGSKNPSVLAQAQADLHKAQAEGARVAADVQKKLNGL